MDFWLAHECVRADLSIFEHFLGDIDAFDNALDTRLSDAMPSALQPHESPSLLYI